MKVPQGYTEAQVLEAIDKIAKMLAPGFAFGFYSVEDIEQEARIFGMECLDKYDINRPLPNFLCRHIKNRLINLKRNKLCRNDAPCRQCHEGFPCDNGKYCKRYQVWRNRQSSKANLMKPVDLTLVADEYKHDGRVSEGIEINEIVKLVDEHLAVELRANFLQMRAGLKVPKAARLEVENAVKEILECHQEKL